MKKKESYKNPVFFISAIIIGLLVIIGAFLPAQFGAVAQTLFDFTTINFGWFYLFAVFVIILFLVGISVSKYGKTRLGPSDSRPEYPFFTWIGMMFSAGFGVSLVFWSVAEPMSHFFVTPFPGLEAQSEEAARVAMGYSFFHWGISQWAVFALAGLAIGFLQFRKNRTGLVSAAIEPVIGKNRAVANTVNILAVIATVMGVATTVGLSFIQLNGGLASVFNVPHNIGVQVIIALVMLAAYLTSSITGLDKGIKWLSNINLGLALLLMVIVFFLGPTVFILNSFVLGIGDYISNFVQYSLRLSPYIGGDWVYQWTIFYWAWAIAWSPFVGAFVARVSRGRTIREFVAGVMVVPPAVAIVWIAVFGGTAVYNDLNSGTQIAEAVNEDVTVALFEALGVVPFSDILSIISIVLIFIFMVTSADSATYILGSMTSKGTLNPAMITKIIWGVLITAIALVLLFTGGLNALQTASLTAALPFTVILLFMIVSIVKEIKNKKNE